MTPVGDDGTHRDNHALALSRFVGLVIPARPPELVVHPAEFAELAAVRDGVAADEVGGHDAANGVEAFLDGEVAGDLGCPTQERVELVGLATIADHFLISSSG